MTTATPPTAAQPTMDLAHLRQWLGCTQHSSDTLALRHTHLMAATLGLPTEPLHAGAPLPPLWHWIYFLEGLPPHALGRDGHPARGGFLPPVPLANRMWAGGDVQFLAPLPLGAEVEKTSHIESIDHKSGRSGELVFVTVRHTLHHAGNVVLSEAHDIVYKNPAPANVPRPQAASRPAGTHVRAYTPDSTLLFRYSALTFNGHRIHYDADYCRATEGYDNLVIHGPLNATLLAGFAQEIAGRPLTRFRYRGLQPALLGNTLHLNASANPTGGLDVWVTLPDGSVSMQAHAEYASPA